MTEWTFDLPIPLEDVPMAAESAALPGDVSDGVGDALARVLDADAEDIELELVGWFA